MQRKFLTRLIICLVPCILAGIFVGMAASKESAGGTGFRRGIDLAGGTILVYEVNLDKTLARKGIDAKANPDAASATGLSSDDIKKLAESLKRRIDPADLRNVVVRPVGTTRVEIILPQSGSTSGDKQGSNEEFVQEVKSLVRQVGVLEFRILANVADDDQGIRDAEAAIDNADPKVQEDLANRAKKGLPPPSPAGDYRVSVNGNTQDGVTYEWVELGKEERETLGLSNSFAARPGGLWSSLKAARGKTFKHVYSAGDDGRYTASMLLYSRDFTREKPLKEDADKAVEYFVLTRVSPTDALKVDRDVGLTAGAETDPKTLNPSVSFGFNATGGNRFGKMTERNKPGGGVVRTLAIIMDEKVVSAPSLNAVIRDRGQITGKFDMETVNRQVQILKSGALNAELKPEPVSENTVGPTLGQDTIRRGLLSVGLAFAAVLAFMIFYYRFAGIVACVALLANLLLTVGFMVAVQAAFTLPGLAGIVLMLGMAVDANVLIYERLREERAKGANLVSAIRLGYDRAFGTIIDTHLTSIFTALVLYTFGNDNLKGFAVSLTLGLLISLFTALYMTRLMFDYATHKRWLTDLKMHQLFPRPNFDFMKLRYAMFTITGVLTVAGLALFLARGQGVLNVDFTKGTVYGGRLKPSQERGLSQTGDGKLGLLDLLSEGRQGERLQVKDVVWLTKPSNLADPDAGKTKPAEYVYKIVYSDNSDATVTFANAPDGATEADQLKDVASRASHLPDHSVEQVFLSGQNFSDGKSQLFTVRTTEKEPDLVQVMLDRLLRDEKDNGSLLDTTKATTVVLAGPVATVTLDKPASPRYLKEFVARELMLANRVPLVGGSPAVEAVGVPSTDPAAVKEEDVTGKFTTIRVSVANNPEFKALREASDRLAGLGALGGAIVGADPKATADEAAFAEAVAKGVASFESRPLPDRLETFDPALAADTQGKALGAIGISWLVILGYLWFRFGSWTFGLAAVLCLVHDLCFTLGAIAVCHYAHGTFLGNALGISDFKIDLAAVAALLTLIGFSVNDTIVVFDRIREVRGKNPLLTPQMINESVNQTLSRTVLASLTVFLVVGVLYWFGGEGVHLFSFVMVVGVLVGTYSSIYVASPLLLMFGEGHAAASTKPTTTPEPVSTPG